MSSKERTAEHENIYEVNIQGPESVNEGETAHLLGHVKFHPSIKYLKWQKYHNGDYIDINVHNPKYRGSKNDIGNPILEIHHFDTEDEVAYRLDVVVTSKVPLRSYAHRLKSLRISETPRTEILSNYINKVYCVGEDIKIKVRIHNESSVLCAMWQRGTATGNDNEAIDITLRKYEGTKNTNEEYTLCINDCDENDMNNGPYFLQALCSDNSVIRSDDIHVNIAKEHLKVTLSSMPNEKQMYDQSPEDGSSIYETKVMYNGRVELTATIRSYPKNLPILWIKNSTAVNLSEPKYSGSSCNGDKHVLRIKNVTKDDADIYKIEAQGEFKGKQISDTLKIIVAGEIPKVRLELSAQSQPVTIGNTMQFIAEIKSCPAPTGIQWQKNANIIQSDGQRILIDDKNKKTLILEIKNVDLSDDGEYCITITNALGSAKDQISIKVGVNKLFISGPVVVSPQGYIRFKTIYPKGSNVLQGKWIKTTNDESTEIDFSKQGYCMRNYGGDPPFQYVEIPNARENVGTYQLSFNDMKSNTINVFLHDTERFSTENEQNCLRFFALQDVSRKTLKTKIATMFDDFKTTWDKFEAFCKKHKKEIILPSKTPSSFDDLDLSVMCGMFQHFSKRTPTRGWDKDPGVNDKEIADDVKRIRKYRNEISHGTSTEMTTEDFNDSVMDLIGAIQRLSGDDADLISQICNELNKVFSKGEELDKMMNALKAFRSTEQESERKLAEFEGEDPNAKIPNREQKHDIVTFHHTYASSIVMFEKSTVAFRRWNGDSGVCFMNRPMHTGEKVFLHRKCPTSKILKFGLTNRNPEDEDKSADQSITYHEKSWKQESRYACISLGGNTSLTVSFDDSSQDPEVFSFENLQTNDPLWLVFDFCEVGDVYQISNQSTSTIQNLSQIYLSFWPWPY